MRIVGLCLLVIALVACAPNDALPIKARRVIIADAKISIEVPEGVSVVGRRDRPDQTIYDFSRGREVIMGLYVGLAPSFHPAKDEVGVETETVGGLSAQTRVVKTAAGWSRDIVIEASDRRFCHFFYRDLREPELLLADHIIGSLRDQP
jgi:hypothetical protein